MHSLQKFDETLEKMIRLQQEKILKMAAELGVHLTREDILNPHDYPELLRSPRFNFEDGLLAGLLSTQTALHRSLKEGGL